MFKQISNKLTNVLGRTGLRIKKNSPEILIVVGITSILGATVLACRGTLKANDVIEEHQEKINSINEALENHSDRYSEQDRKKDLTVVYMQTSVNWIKLYGPAVTLMATGICCILGGYKIMKNRNIAMMAAYEVLEKGFMAYRKRVIDEYGEEKDYMFKNGLRAEEYEDTEIGENGKAKKVKKTKLVKDSNDSYAVWFTKETSTEWKPTPSYSLMHVIQTQKYMQEMLNVRGAVLLNDVFESLGMKRTNAGSIKGWVQNKEKTKYIDFGLNNDYNLDFISEQTPDALLTFNIDDGVIWNKLEG